MTRRVLLFLLAALTLSACDHGAPAPARASGSAPRIVVLSPALAGTLRWLGLDHLMVGRHGFDGWSDQSLPVCGDQQGFDYETLLRVNPTHILIEWGDRPVPERMAALAKERGWTIRNYSTLTLDDVAKTTDDLAATFSAPGGNPPVPRSQTLRAAWSRRPGPDLAAVGRVLLLVSSAPPTALGPGSAHQQILKGLGGRSALESGGPYQTLDAEDVLKIAPDVIVFVVPRMPGTPPRPVTEARLNDVLGPLCALDIPAVKRGRVVLLDDPEGQLPGAALVKYADALYAALAALAGEPAPSTTGKPAPGGGAP